MRRLGLRRDVFTYHHNHQYHGAEPLSQDSPTRPSSLFPAADSSLTRQTGRYKVHNIVLGSGTYGSVYLATYRNVQVAVKTFHKDKPWAHTARTSKVPEVELMRTLNHPNVQGLLDVLDVTDSLGVACELSVLELVTGGDLYSYLAKYQLLSEKEVQFFGWQLLKGLEYLHKRDVAHRGQSALTTKPCEWT